MEVDNSMLFESVRGMLAEGHTVTLRVKGQSMRPFLEGGQDKVVITPLHEVKRGDMVLAEISQRQFVLHRVVKINGERITLMGDGNLIGTESCDLNDVVGMVGSVIRNGKIINIQSIKCRFYVYLWMALKPIRRYLLAIYTRINKV